MCNVPWNVLVSAYLFTIGGKKKRKNKAQSRTYLCNQWKLTLPNTRKRGMSSNTQEKPCTLHLALFDTALMRALNLLLIAPVAPCWCSPFQHGWFQTPQWPLASSVYALRLILHDHGCASSNKWHKQKQPRVWQRAYCRRHLWHCHLPLWMPLRSPKWTFLHCITQCTAKWWVE